jgi:hypothetical protein
VGGRGEDIFLFFTPGQNRAFGFGRGTEYEAKEDIEAFGKILELMHVIDVPVAVGYSQPMENTKKPDTSEKSST